MRADGDARRIVEEWVIFLRQEKLWGNDEPAVCSDIVQLGESTKFEGGGHRPQALEHRHAEPDQP